MTIGINLSNIQRVLFSGWLLLILIGVTIAFNALYMQQARHPAPFYATRIAASDIGRPAMPAKSTIRAIQTALKKLGFYSGVVDGIAGPETEAAIKRFEHAARHAVTGRADEALLAKLNHALPPKPRVEPRNAAANLAIPAKVTAPSPDPMVAVVQESLSDAAYGPLTADGLMGSRTVDAISRFQLDHGMTVTGSIDDALIKRLIEIGAMDGVRR